MADAARQPIRLYSFVMSPFAAKVHCFLLYKGLDFECWYVDPRRMRRELPVGSQVPVLTVGRESRADSTPIGLWLDECFPARPRLLPPEGEERERLLAVDRWVSDRLIPGSFRSYPGEGVDRLLNGWKLAWVLARTARRGLPWPLRLAWPLVIRRLRFVRRQVALADDGLPVRESKLRLYDEFLAHLEGGPFVGGRSVPSLPDLAAYPQFTLFWSTGFRGSEDVLERPELMAWLGRMRPYLAGEPPLVPPPVRLRPLPG